MKYQKKMSGTTIISVMVTGKKKLMKSIKYLYESYYCLIEFIMFIVAAYNICNSLYLNINAKFH